MIILHFLISAATALFLWLPVYLAGFPMVAIGLVFCDETSEHMPGFFWLWDNPDAGINGILGGRNPIWPRLTNNRHRTYCCRWKWLAWRNPTCGFSRRIGVKIEDSSSVIHKESAWGWIKLTTNFMRSRAMEFMGSFWWWDWWDYAIEIRYWNTGRGFYWRWGWKLSAYKTAKPDDVPPIAQRMFRISPCKQL
jgi:hypothetical protein